ncbi:tRNA dihydrouridine synthase [Ponticaulis koreensis]|uniref:tRNA dihydrouridine synthase n=1 Tax=Ponticaulis koreensis TaxID=1123045 RepID=UPI0003B2F965|nr:tRNA-dihydrouridine synthase [Ponticaulis koreensis]
MGPYAFSRNETPVFLAPMSGVTDAPFRKQVMKFGAETTITEMVAGDDLRNGNQDSENRIVVGHYPGIHTVQLVGREAEALRYGAERARHAGADIIDINMGCPSRRVTGGLSGSALMRDPAHAQTLIEAVIDGAQGLPVTLKMRLGWDRDEMTAVELALRAQDVGVELIAVHGRTRQDFYDGEADWAAIRPVVDAVDLPVIANGDIVCLESAKEALKLSGAAGVMVGRAATGRPWFIAQLQASLNGREYNTPGLGLQIESLAEQARDSVELYGQRVGMKVVRKHIVEALEGWRNDFDVSLSAEMRKSVLTSQSPDDLVSTLNGFMAEGQVAA